MTGLPFHHKISLYEHAFHQAVVGKGILALDGRFLEVNAALCTMLGYTQEELLSLKFQDVTFADDLELSLSYKDQLMNGVIDSIQFTKRYVHKSGHLVWAQVIVTIMRNDQGEPFFLSQFQDITDKKAIEDMLKESEQKYKSLFEHHPDLVYSLSIQNELMSVNSACERITGYAKDELSHISQIVVPEHIKIFNSLFRSAAQGNTEEFEVSVIHKLGHRLMLRITNIPIMIEGNVTGVYGIAKDMSEYELKSEKLHKVQELFTLISENTQDVITFSTPDGITRYVSPSLRFVLGYDPEEAAGRNVMEFWHPEDTAAVLNSDLLQHSDSGTFECRVLHKQGYYVWFETSVKAIRNEQGAIEKIIGIGRNITERKAAEEELRRREAVYRRIVEESPDAIAISKNDQWVYVNDTLVTLFGGESKEDMIQTPSFEFVHPEYHDIVRKRMDSVRQGQTAELMEQKLLKKNGDVIHVESMTMPTVYQGEAATHTILRDITQRKLDQERLIQSEKLSVAGQLAAGIAHEIRNPLTAIKGFIDILKVNFKPSYLGIISEEVKRIEEILTELLILAKPQAHKFTKANVTATVQQVVTLLETQAIMKNIQIQTDFDINVPEMECDENQLKQVWINYLKNGIEAMGNGGIINVAVKREERGISITFGDQGTGMSEEQIKRLGEPFFSTKEQGTGLGFMISRKIIENHGGQIDITSDIGQGTTIRIFLPIN